MSFLKIRDPTKRNQMVEEYLDLKKNIRDNLLSERTGEQQLQTDLSKFYRLITETQKDTAREIREGLKPIKEGIVNLPQAMQPIKNLLENITLPRVCVFPGPTRNIGLEFPALTAPLANYSIYVSILMKLAPNESLVYKLFNDI